MNEARKVILITDGDEYARKSLEAAAREIGGTCLSLSHGNPTSQAYLVKFWSS